MFGSARPFGRAGHGVDRFSDSLNGSRYPHARGSRNGSSQTKQHSKQVMDEEHIVSEVCSRAVSSPVSASGRKVRCNLDRFLEYTTPTVPLQYLPKTFMKGWRVSDAESMPFFSLGDLWESFNEWSAYGAGVPIVLNGSDTVMQYYVPSLSAIQLDTHPSGPNIGSRRPGEESDVSDGDYRDTGSEGSSSDEAEQEGFSSDDGEGSSCLSFQYFERAAPYSREPLADKIENLAKNFPQLKTLRSIDLLQTSWLSVAWYPIYRIPTGPTLRDLAACFLTFHSLSTPLKDGGSVDVSTGGKSVPVTPISNSGGSPKIALPVFGLASYKSKGTVWSTTGNCERQQAISLLQTADQWLRSHQVKHPDYDFFLSHGSSY